ncbi:DNA/RNA non-specific endonuclease [Marinicella sp. S1101]|uniref:DNA/RNA non-specific endonuclease n=1 Tax=Marinicella marina TaxID=2996016 RepID=UPI002260BE8E|nr:DNA/RNA non-specific endonuclease [Marinicella marina]MCX7553070.1 DNA/RNA non-specific endonuclease [Marinicella marina]
MKIGYDIGFIGDGIWVPLPRITPAIEGGVLKRQEMRDLIYLDYLHYTVVMNKTTRQPLFTALNIDQNLFRKTTSKGNWKSDTRAGRENQLTNDYYRINDWDKGHMVMRWNTAWGEDQYEAQTADDESYYYTNAAFQHENFNRDEWLALEKNVERKFAEDSNNKLCVFTGPIHGSLDRHYERGWHDSVRIPSGFFKIICYKPKQSSDSKIGVKAFVMYQDDEMIKDRQGGSRIKFAQYQETIRIIEEMTGLDFGRELFDANPMMYFETTERRKTLNISTFPEGRLVTSSDDIVDDHVRDYSMDPQSNSDIVIASALVNPKKNESVSEYVILINRSSKDINLNGWKLSDEKNLSINLQGKIKSGGAKTIMGDQLKPIRLRNNGGALKLFNSEPSLVDHAIWSANDSRRSKGKAILFKK